MTPIFLTFTVVERVEQLVEGEVHYKLVLRCYQAGHEGRLGVAVTRAEFDKSPVGTSIPCAIGFTEGTPL